MTQSQRVRQREGGAVGTLRTPTAMHSRTTQSRNRQKSWAGACIAPVGRMVSKSKVGIDVMGTLQTPTHLHQRVQGLEDANVAHAGVGMLQTPVLR